jgi:hypothetical protein
MMQLMTRMMTVVLALMLALPTAGCEKKDTEKDRQKEKALDVQIDAGPAKVKVEGSRKPDGTGRHINVEVGGHSGHEHESGDRDK